MRPTTDFFEESSHLSSLLYDRSGPLGLHLCYVDNALKVRNPPAPAGLSPRVTNWKSLLPIGCTKSLLKTASKNDARVLWRRSPTVRTPLDISHKLGKRPGQPGVCISAGYVDEPCSSPVCAHLWPDRKYNFCSILVDNYCYPLSENSEDTPLWSLALSGFATKHSHRAGRGA